MKSEFQKCLDKDKVVPSSAAKNLVKKELKVAGSDLAEARDRLKHGSFKWYTVVSYYAMFHAAWALLYSRGYKERSHRCLAAAVDELFARPGII